ncbi:Intraflagellar transport protein 52 [Tritrichomonas musculus]|uniref:Intraflagellar transport protein 52 n=1 Tax=Tritrichomonas musculus TaxID=1915356 RepID=A0ABR2IZ90_9EUKA
MSIVSLIDAGHHELYHRDKKLSAFISAVSPTTEPRPFKGLITADVLKDIKAIWFFGPTRDLKVEELSELDSFMQRGGSIIILSGHLMPNFESLIKKYGVSIVEPVVSPTYITYINPHHVSVQHGLVNRALTHFLQDDQNASFAYPDGYTLDVNSPSVIMLASGQSSYPLNRPIISYATVGTAGGTLTVIGSPHMFGDEWIKKESNEKLLQFLLELILTKREELNQIDADHPEITERYYTPDVASMSERLRSCIQESEKMRTNFTDNFDRGLFKMDMGFVSDTQELAKTLGLKNEPLETVTPQFDTALPPLTPAVYPPQMREPPGPVLELFDLDDAFASPKTRLAQLAQRTTPKNAEKFVIQSAKILGILPKLPEDKQTGKNVLEYVFTQVVRWKRQSAD